MKHSENYHRTLLALACIFILVGFVPTGLRLFAALDETTNHAVVTAGVPVKAP
jgi:hypothetical protein